MGLGCERSPVTRLNIRTKLFAGFGIAIAILLIISVVAFIGVRSLVTNQESVTHTHEVIAELQTVLTEMVNAETGQRGFIITGEERYLEPYDSGVAQIHKSIDEVTQLTIDNPRQQGRIANLMPLVSEKLTELNDTIQLRQSEAFEAAQAVVLSDVGRQTADEIRAVIGEMIAEEERLLADQTDATASSSRLVENVIVGGFAGALLLAALISFFLSSAIGGGAAKVSAAMNSIARGDLTAKVDIKSSDELGQMARGFNSMAAALSQKDAQLRGRTAELEAANRELEAFSYSVSHDLRAPLRSIDGFSHALVEDQADKLDEQGKNLLGRVRAAAQRMGQLIDDLLVLSRVTRGEMHRERVDMSALARATAEELRKEGPEREAEFIIADGLVANGDEQLLRVVLANLLGNAWKFTSKHEKARIEFAAARQQSGEPAYFVRDDGAGFDMTYADKLFGPFQRLHGTDEFSGSGIGLASVQRIIHRHGGRVWAEAEVEHGATFYFTLQG